LNTPIILVCGGAGSGKDTTAAFIAKYTNGVCIAQADPMKRFAKDVFGFTEEQLWGPSECRNAEDPRYAAPDTWEGADATMGSYTTDQWIQSVLPNVKGEALTRATLALDQWFSKLAKDHGVIFGKRMGAATQPTRILTPRYVLQTLGTEWGRTVGPTMWNDYALRMAVKLLTGDFTGYDRTYGGHAKQGEAPHDYIILTDGRFRNEILGIKKIGGYVINVVSPSEDGSATEKAGVAGHKSEAELKSIPRHFFDAVLVNDKSNGLGTLEYTVRELVSNIASPDVYTTNWYKTQS